MTVKPILEGRHTVSPDELKRRVESHGKKQT